MCPKLGVRVSPRSLLRALGQGCQLCFDTKTFSSSCSRLGCSIPGLVWGSGAARLDAAGCASTVMEMSLQTSSLKTTFTRWPDLCGLEPAGATREGFQPPNTPRERGGGRKGGGTSSPSQGGIEEQCSAQRCSEHLHTCGQPRVTQAPAGITQHRGGLLKLHLPLHFLAGLPGGSAQGIKPYMVCSVEPLAEPSFSTPKCGLVCPGVGGKLQRIQILHPLPPQIPAWS